MAKGKLSCASSLFCFSKKKKRRQCNLDPKFNGSDKSNQRVSFDPKTRPASPSAKSDYSIASSGKSSVYHDAIEDHPDYSPTTDPDSLYEENDDLQHEIDGQYFFSARDALEGIKLYPPVPTVGPDEATKYPITDDMQTLLYSYQHGEKKMEESETNLVGEAMEHQAERLLGASKEQPLEVFESTTTLLEELHKPQVRITERGFPGELTEGELEAVKSFKEELKKRDAIYTDIVSSFSSVEKEAYALCRFLRARKFNVPAVFALLDQAKEGFAKAQENDFYPDLEEALGWPKCVFLSQYPAVFGGNARNGCPVLYLRAGAIRPEGVKCLVSLDKVDRFFYNDIMHTLRPLISEGKRINPNLVRCENLNIYDLKGVSKAQFTSDTFDMIKVGNDVMTSFPETLHCLLIINAPSWFGLIWSVVKKLIDPRTASKIEVFTSAKAGLARMNELIDESQIPADYGGLGPALADASGSVGDEPQSGRRKVVVLNHLMTLTKKHMEKTREFTVEEGICCTLKLYSRCSSGVHVELFKSDSDSAIVNMNVVGGEEEEPYSRTVGTCEGGEVYRLRLVGKVPGSFLILGIMST